MLVNKWHEKLDNALWAISPGVMKELNMQRMGYPLYLSPPVTPPPLPFSSPILFQSSPLSLIPFTTLPLALFQFFFTSSERERESGRCLSVPPLKTNTCYPPPNPLPSNA